MNKFTASKSTFYDDIGRNGDFQNFNYLVNDVHKLLLTGYFKKQTNCCVKLFPLSSKQVLSEVVKALRLEEFWVSTLKFDKTGRNREVCEYGKKRAQSGGTRLHAKETSGTLPFTSFVEISLSDRGKSKIIQINGFSPDQENKNAGYNACFIWVDTLS